MLTNSALITPCSNVKLPPIILGDAALSKSYARSRQLFDIVLLTYDVRTGLLETSRKGSIGMEDLFVAGLDLTIFFCEVRRPSKVWEVDLAKEEDCDLNESFRPPTGRCDFCVGFFYILHKIQI